MLSSSLLVDGSYGGHNFKLFVPGSDSPGRAMPLVMMLHGCTQDPTQFAAGTQMNALAESEGLPMAISPTRHLLPPPALHAEGAPTVDRSIATGPGTVTVVLPMSALGSFPGPSGRLQLRLRATTAIDLQADTIAFHGGSDGPLSPALLLTY